MRILIASPIPSHPTYQGNSARIEFIAQSLRLRGHYIGFLYYGMEGISDFSRQTMNDFFDEFYYLPSKVETQKRSLGKDYGVDDWADLSIGKIINALFVNRHYDCIVVNYVWFSWILDFIPGYALKIVDTHDRFGGRRFDAEKVGLEPNWFYTTEAEEAKGLNRADIVFAITKEESEYFKKIGVTSDIKIIGYYPINSEFLSSKSNLKTFGYLGSSNPWNVNSIQKLLGSLRMPKGYRMLIGGSISNNIMTSLNRNIISIGNVENLSNFFTQTSYFINPMIGSTGLKIKTLDALSFGCPVIGLPDSFSGLERLQNNYWGSFKSITELVNSLPQIVKRNYSADKKFTRKVYEEYRSVVIRNLSEIFGKFE